MRQKMLAGAVLSLGLPLSALAAAPSVAVDIAPLHSLVSQVMAGVNKPDLLIPAEASPHEYTLRPSEAKALADAEVVFWMGEELTPWLEKALDNVAESSHKVSMLKLHDTVTHEFREGATFEGHAHNDDEHHDEHDEHAEDEHHEEHDKHDEHSEDEHHDEHEGHDDHAHEGVDPHAWLDPQNAKTWIVEIAEILSKKDPANAAAYAANAKQAIASLDGLIDKTQREIDAMGDLKFVVFHDAYQYFARRFGLAAVGSISIGHAEDPSPARVDEIRDTVKKLGVTCVFSEPQYNPGLVDSVFEGTTVSAVGVMDPLGASIPEGNQHYKALMQGMVNSLKECG